MGKTHTAEGETFKSLLDSLAHAREKNLRIMKHPGTAAPLDCSVRQWRRAVQQQRSVWRKASFGDFVVWRASCQDAFASLGNLNLSFNGSSLTEMFHDARLCVAAKERLGLH